MEVEENSQSEDKASTSATCQVDVDSGIENMEVDEAKETKHIVSRLTHKSGDKRKT